jgi:cell shape-determining protein MreC
MQKLISEKSELERSGQRLQQKILFLQRDYQQLSDKIKEAQEKERVSAAPPVTVSGRTEEQEPSTVTPSYSQTIELPPIVVKKDSASTALPVRAQVVEANGTKRFVVIDKGSNDGVTNGMNFDILRGGNKIAQVVAVRVRPTIAACDVSFSQSPQVLRSGDTAVQRSQ